MSVRIGGNEPELLTIAHLSLGYISLFDDMLYNCTNEFTSIIVLKFLRNRDENYEQTLKSVSAVLNAISKI